MTAVRRYNSSNVVQAGNDIIWTYGGSGHSGFRIEARSQTYNGTWSAWSGIASPSQSTRTYFHNPAAHNSNWQYRIQTYTTGAAADSAWVTTNVVAMTGNAPQITSTSAVRATSNGTQNNDTGTYLKQRAAWTIDNSGGCALKSATVSWREYDMYEAAANAGNPIEILGSQPLPIEGAVSLNGGHNNVATTTGSGLLNVQKRFVVTWEVTDTFNRTTGRSTLLPGAARFLHFYPGAKRLGIGQLCQKDDTLQIGLQTEFNRPAYQKTLAAYEPNSPALLTKISQTGWDVTEWEAVAGPGVISMRITVKRTGAAIAGNTIINLDLATLHNWGPYLGAMMTHERNDIAQVTPRSGGQSTFNLAMTGPHQWAQNGVKTFYGTWVGLQ